MKLVIREEALDDLDDIYDWIAKDYQAAAVRVVPVLRESTAHQSIAEQSVVKLNSSAVWESGAGRCRP